MKIQAFLTALLLLAASSALAAARAHIVVEGVQTPAWVERSSGARDALAIGMALGNQDRILTGAGARALLRLAEVSTQDDALAIYDRLRDAGYAAEIRPVKSEAGQIYRVRIAHLPSRQEADALAGKLKGRMGIAEPKVSM